MDEERARLEIERIAVEVGPAAMNVALAMLGDRALAEDALQDALVQAYRGLPGYRGEASRKTWFMRILVNSCRRHRVLLGRWTSRRAEAHLALAPEQAPAEGSDPALRARLERAVVGLPHRQRTAFVLRYAQDLGIDEIAAIMGCAPGTVKATIHKAVTRLRRELADLMGGDA
jgi:RNA polymerase sigma factor (sigma-70 family)